MPPDLVHVRAIEVALVALNYFAHGFQLWVAVHQVLYLFSYMKGFSPTIIPNTELQIGRGKRGNLY